MREVVFAYPGDLNTATGGYGYDRRLVAALRDHGHPVHLLHLPGAFPTPSEADTAEALRRLAAVPDGAALVVDGLAYSTFPRERLAAVRAPLVALVHHPLALETGIDPARAPTVAATERAALAQARAVVVTSPHTRDTLVADYAVPAEAITVALPGLDPAWRTVPRTPSEPPALVAVGSVSPRKGFDALVDALGWLGDLTWTAHIVGSLDRDPAAGAALRGQVAASPVGDRIRLHGEADEGTIRRIFADATLFTLASRYEGFGMVFAEAMAAGLPIVATAGGAIPEVVPHEAGLLVPVDDTRALADALRRVLTDSALRERLAAGAAAAGARFYGWDETGRIVSRRIARLSP